MPDEPEGVVFLSVCLSVCLTAVCLVVVTGEAMALCPTDEPLSAPEAEGDPYYAELCGLNDPSGGVPLPCPTPLPPQLEAGSVRAQGFTVTATVGGAISSAHAVWWRVEQVDPATGVPSELWTWRSVQGVPANGWPEGTVVRFGVPGLLENHDYHVRVAFESAGGAKTCWSSRSAPITTAALSTCPAPPSGMQLRVEEDFDRPATDPRFGTPAGDGLGPGEVWSPSDAYSESKVWIAADGISAKTDPSSAMIYEAQTERDSISYAETEVRVDLGLEDGFQYNFQVQARIGQTDPATGSTPSYAVKLVRGARQCSSASLLIFQLPDEYTVARCNADGTAPDPLIGGTVCEFEPPMTVEDPDRPGVSLPVWLRIEIQRDADGLPVVVGKATWNDVDGTQRTCTASRSFTVPDNWCSAPVECRWGASFHEMTYLVDAFCAGDGTP